MNVVADNTTASARRDADYAAAKLVSRNEEAASRAE
jgi:hypothetical protein